MYSLLNCDRKFLDLVFTMNFSLGCLLINEFFLSFLIDICHCNRIIFASFPESLSSLGPENIVIDLHLLIMVLKVAICHHIIVSLNFIFQRFTCYSILLSGFWSLSRRLEMVIFHIGVADDVIIYNCVLAGAEIPRFLLGIVGTTFKTLQLIVEVQNVICLFISQSVVFVLSKYFN